MKESRKSKFKNFNTHIKHIYYINTQKQRLSLSCQKKTQLNTDYIIAHIK